MSRKEEDKEKWTDKKGERSLHPSLDLSLCVCLLYWEGTLVKVSVALYQHSRGGGEKVARKDELNETEKKQGEEECLFSPSSLLYSAFSLPFCTFKDACFSLYVCVQSIWHTWILYWLPLAHHVFLESF